MNYLSESSSKPPYKDRKFKSWSKQETVGGITKCIRVEEVLNGYIITYSRYGTPDSDEEKKEYISEEYRKISTSNPFGEKEEEDEGDVMDNLLTSAKDSLF